MGAPADNRPPEERFATQLEQLQGMGFPDRASNIQALVQANGDVNQAINFLLGGWSDRLAWIREHIYFPSGL